MSPQTIKRAKFAEVLNKPSSNKQQAKKFIAKYSIDYSIENIILPEGFVLKSNKHKTEIRLLDRTDKDNPRIAYAVDIKVTNKKIGRQSCTQILVWVGNNRQYRDLKLPEKLFAHLLKIYAIMITDKEQTLDGKRFWKNQIGDAFIEGMFVYFLDKNDPALQLQLIKDNDDFLENYEPKGWGDDQSHQNVLFIISASQIL